MSSRRNRIGQFKRDQARRARAAANVTKPIPPRQETEILDDLRSLCREPGFAHVIAHTAVRDNFILYREEMKPSDLEPLYGFNRLIRTEITMLIGYMVQGGSDAFDQLPAEPQALLEKAERLLKELHRRLNWCWTEKMQAGGLEGLEEAQAKGEALREPIFYNGESVFGFQYQDFALEKYQADNAWLADKRGFTIEDANRIVEAILCIHEEQITSRLKMVSASGGADWTVLPALIITAEDVEKRCGLPAKTIGAVLDALSIPLGTNQGFQTLSDFNQAAASPLIALDEQRYAAFQYYALVEALYDAPFYWMFADDAYRATAAKNRGDFTEAFTLRRLQEVFGPANVHRGLNLERGKGNRVGEIDILVEFGGRLLLVQAKSKRLTLAARRGDETKLRSDFKAAVQDAYDQALCCAEALFDPSVRILTSDGKPLSLRHVPTKVYPMCLVADHYPALVTQVDRFLVKRKVVKVAEPIVTDIFALDALCEMLDRPLRFVGYCELRDRFGERLIYSHELILLSYHVRQNLWIDDDYDGALLDDTIGADLEIAMLARRRGIEGAKTPEGPLTLFAGTTFDAMLARIEDRPEPAMIDLGLFMLETSGGTIKAFNEGVEMIVSRARSDLGPHDFSLKIGPAGLTVHCSYESPKAVRGRLEAHVEARKYATKSDRWFGIFLNPDDGLPSVGLMLDFPWSDDPDRESLAALLPNRGHAKSLSAALKKSRGRQTADR
jgi:hypothetical protein